MIELTNSTNRKEGPGNKKSDIVEKIFDFRKLQKDKEIKILNPKQMLQRLPSNTSENLLNKISQVILTFFASRKRRYLKSI